MIIILISLLLCFSTQLYAECSDLNYSECSEYPEYCEWNDESEVCQDIGGGGTGGSNDNYGPYEFTYLTESEGIQSSDQSKFELSFLNLYGFYRIKLLHFLD